MFEDRSQTSRLAGMKNPTLRGSAALGQNAAETPGQGPDGQSGFPDRQPDHDGRQALAQRVNRLQASLDELERQIARQRSQFPPSDAALKQLAGARRRIRDEIVSLRELQRTLGAGPPPGSG
ncbi:MAG: hypothetical protein KDA73_00820 [Rhodobacteraceae bacterium]|nr:hypothetical protein [Paracoccaceae bacterium]